MPQLSQEGVGFSPCYGATRTQRFFRGYSAAGSQFFRDHQVSMGRNLLQSERNAGLLIGVLRSLVAERMFEMDDFVIIPDHVHLLLSVGEGMTIEKAMQLIKGRFSFRLKKEFGYLGEVWQRGFSEVQVLGRESFDAHRAYIAENPVKAGLVRSPEDFPFCFGFLARKKALQGLKPSS